MAIVEHFSTCKPTRNLLTPSTAPAIGPSGRSRLGRMQGVQMVAFGSYVPDNIVPNEQLAELGCDSDWIQRRTGILQRRRAAPNQATSDLAIQAGRRCLEKAGVSAKDVDLLIVATMTPDFLSPASSCVVQRALGCIAPAMDINAACSGFMYSVITAGQFLRMGTASCALVIGAEVMSRIVNPKDAKTFPLFGDGAGAVLMRATDDMSKGFASFTLGAEGDGGETLSVPGGGSRQPLTKDLMDQGVHYIHMDGKSVFKWAVNTVTDSARDCLDHAGTTIDQMDCVILHQANSRIIDAAVSDFHIDPNKVFINLDRYGNTSAASIPLAIDEAISTGKLPADGKALLCGFGAGLTWGAGVLQL